jgi:hypothetical protein
MISRVAASVLAPNFGRQLTPGAVVDLDERLPGGGTLADHVRVDWFDPMPEPVAPSKKSSPKPAQPVMPDTEENRNG